MARVRFASLVAMMAISSTFIVAAAPGSAESRSTSSDCTTSELSSSGPLSSTYVSDPSAALDGPLQTSSASGVSNAGRLSLVQQLLLAETAADRFALLPDDAQFVFDFNQPQGTAGDGGNITVASRKTFPALIGTGAGMAVGRVGPCGLNTFHVHPRSAELQLVVEGRLMTEMVPENGVVDNDGNPRDIKNEIGPFQLTPFYQGSIHTQFNPDCSDAIFVASFASEDFGTGQILDQTLAFADNIIAAAFGQAVAGADIDAVREAIPANIALGVDECLQKCGIEKRAH